MNAPRTWNPWLVTGLLVAFTLLTTIWYVPAGFTVDDYAIVDLLQRDPLPFSRWKGVWSTQEVDVFQSLWFFGPDWVGLLWRPLASLVIEASLRLFGPTATPLHLLAVACHAWVGVGIYLLIRRSTGKDLLAVLAALLFLGCEKLGMVVGWVATLTDPLGMSFTVGALLAGQTYLSGRRRVWWALSMLLMALAYPCKESAVLTPILLAMLAWCAPSGRFEAEVRPLGERWRAWWGAPLAWAPGLGMMLVYLGVYKTLHLGEMNNLMYTSPMDDPGAYLEHLVLHLPAMWLGTLSPVWPSFSMFDTRLLVPLAVGGVLSMAVLGLALWPLRRDPLVQWSFLAYHLVLLPQMSADASERGLYVPVAMAAPMLAVLITSIGPLARRGLGPSAPWFTRLNGWWVTTGVLGLGAVMSVAMGPSMAAGNQETEAQFRSAIQLVDQRAPKNVVFVNTSGMMVTLYPQPILAFFSAAGREAEVRVMSSANAIFTLERVGLDRLILRADRPGWMTNLFSRLARTEPEVRVGQTFDTPIFQARVLETTPAGDDALAVEFTFHAPLSDPDTLFLLWTGQEYEALDPMTLPEGAQRALTDTSDVWATL